MPQSATRIRGTTRALELLIEIPAVVVTFVMMLHISLNAVLRTWFNSPIGNTLEVVTYWYLPLVAFLGFLAAAHRGQHIAADLIYEMLPRVTQPFVLATLFVVSSLVSLGFAWFGFGEAMHAKDIEKTAGVSDLIAWPVYFLVPLAFGILTIQFLYVAFRALRRPEDAHVDGDSDDAAMPEETSVRKEALR